MDCFSLQIKLDSLDGPIYFTLSISIFFNFSIRDIFKWFLCPLEIFLSFSGLLTTRCSVLISSTIWKEFKIDDCLERILGNFWVSISVTRLDNLLHFGQLFKACGKNYFAQIAHISGNFSKGVKNSCEIIFGQLLFTFGDFLLVTLDLLFIRRNQVSGFNETFCRP